MQVSKISRASVGSLVVLAGGCISYGMSMPAVLASAVHAQTAPEKTSGFTVLAEEPAPAAVITTTEQTQGILLRTAPPPPSGPITTPPVQIDILLGRLTASATQARLTFTTATNITGEVVDTGKLEDGFAALRGRRPILVTRVTMGTPGTDVIVWARSSTETWVFFPATSLMYPYGAQTGSVGLWQNDPPGVPVAQRSITPGQAMKVVDVSNPSSWELENITALAPAEAAAYAEMVDRSKDAFSAVAPPL